MVQAINRFHMRKEEEIVQVVMAQDLVE